MKVQCFESFKQEFSSLKSKFDRLEGKIEKEIDQLNEQSRDLIKIQEQAIQTKEQSGDKQITFNVRGKRIITTIGTLLSMKDTLLYRMATDDRFLKLDEIFIDVDPFYFSLILDYIRYRTIDLKVMKITEVKFFRDICQFFQIGDILEKTDYTTNKLEIVNITVSATYFYNGMMVGSMDVEDLISEDTTKGVVAQYQGTNSHIILEFNREVEISSIKIAGYAGNATAFYVGNGQNCPVYTSVDGFDWKSVGNLPQSITAAIVDVNLTPSIAKYIKFQYTSYIGLGYFAFNEEH